jgi:hypothetical protein
MQAYADDLLLFADTKEHLNMLIDVITEFMRYARIAFNSSKCRLFIHNPHHEDIAVTFLPYINNEEVRGKVCRLKDTVK